MLGRVAHRLPRPAIVPRTVQRLLCSAKPGARGPNPKPRPGAQAGERVPDKSLERQLARELQDRLTPVERELRELLLQKRYKAEAEVERLKAEVKHVISRGQAEFHTWRRRNMVALVGGGIVVGAAGFGGGGYIYVRRNPSTIEHVVTWIAREVFEGADSYQGRLQVYRGTPEPEVSFTTIEAAILDRVIRLWSSSEPRDGASASASAAHGSARVAAVWGQMVSGAFAAVEGSLLLATKAEFRRRLIEEVMAAPAEAMPLKQKLAELRELLLASIERDVLCSRLLEDHLSRVRGLGLGGANLARARARRARARARARALPLTSTSGWRRKSSRPTLRATTRSA